MISLDGLESAENVCRYKLTAMILKEIACSSSYGLEERLMKRTKQLLRSGIALLK